MSSMVSKLHNTPLALVAALAAGGVVAMPGQALAQTTQTNTGGSLVAYQAGQMGAALARWEMLQANSELSFAEYAGFALAYPEFPRLEIVRLRAEKALDREAPPQSEILRFFDTHKPLTNSGRSRYALSLAQAQRPQAFEVARHAWRSGSMGGPTEAYLSGLYGSRFTPEDHAARMDALLWQGDVDAAARQVVNLDPANRPLAMARLALIRGAMPDEAGVIAPAQARSDAGYLYNLSGHLRKSGRMGEAIQLLATRPSVARPALDPEAMVGEMLTVAKAASAADTVSIASRIDDMFAPGQDISLGSFRLRDRYTDLMWMGGTNALWRLGDGNRAAPMFERYGRAARTPLTRAKGFYWAGRAARQAGDQTSAARYFEEAAAYPHYYYGQLALSALGRPMPQFAALPQVDIDPALRSEFNSRPLVQAIRHMANNRRDWRTERRFFEALGESAKTRAELRLAADLARETGLDEMAVVLGMEAGANGITGFERLGFPTVDTPPVSDWAMVHAISRQESEFDRTRVSHAGARGVMQLMPGTAREQAGKLGMEYLSANLTGSPHYNIRLGDAYFQRMLDYYGGSYPLALGAYNAGPGRVNQWLRLNGDPRTGEIDYVTWIEKIPSNFETRYYIMRVLGNAVTYSHMYPERSGLPRPIDALLR